MNLQRLFNPRAIAIIGASADATTINGQPQRNLLGRGYGGAIYPVNPKYAELGGLPCHASVDALPEAPDLAIILLSADRAVQSVIDCGRRGIPFAIVIGAGFAETGPDGERLQAELVRAARAHGIRLLGPNCIGLMNLVDNVFAGFGPVFGMPALRTGSVSFVTQSGGFGFSVVNMAEELGLGFRYVVSTGNEADLTSLDLIDGLIDDPQTSVIAAYFEGIKDARRLPALGRRALDSGKPVIVWKVGNSPEGKRAAASHTGNLGGATELYQAAFDQFGWIRIDDVQDLVDYTAAFARGKLPANDNIGIVTVSGGAGVLMADACASLRLTVPALSAPTIARLREVLPAYASVDNPVDVTASILNDSGLIRSALSIILEDPSVGTLLVVASSVQGPAARVIADAIVGLDSRTEKPVLVSWSSRETLVGEAYAALRTARVPLYRTPTRTCKAAGALCRFADAQRRHRRDSAENAAARSMAADPLPMTGRHSIAEHQAKRRLAEQGLACTTERLATSADEAVAIASTIGGRVALKVQSVDIPHKTEAGGVRLDVQGAHAVRVAWSEIVSNVHRHSPNANLDGVLVQEMISGGVEMILGAVNDERFGAAIMVGLGGIFTELLKDVVFRFVPVRASAAREMVDALRGRAVLAGARGLPEADVDALVDAIVKVSRLVEAHGTTPIEIDINPLVVLAAGQGVRVVDALISTGSAIDAPAPPVRPIVPVAGIESD